MKELSRRDPLDLWDDAQEIFRPIFDGFNIARRGQPAVDVREKYDAYILEAELPAMTEKDVDVRIDNGLLVISSEQTEERENKDGDYIHKERRMRSFSRTFRLPKEVDESKIDAGFSRGVLRLTLPKMGEQQERGRKIAVHGTK